MLAQVDGGALGKVSLTSTKPLIGSIDLTLGSCTPETLANKETSV